MKIDDTNFRLIDHIVYTVFDLDKSVDDFEKLLGVRPIFGGYHKTFGTKNALVNLDNGIYLELLAADNSNTEVQRPRWMGVDVLKEEQITRWALKSDTLEKDGLAVKGINSKMGRISGGSRNTVDGKLLQWELLMPLPLPEVELMPFMVDWSKSETHPHDEMPNMGCELLELYGTHPNPGSYLEIINTLKVPLRIKKSTETRLRMRLKCHKGILEL